MRDPLFPLVIALIILLTVWLGVFGPIISEAEAKGWATAIHPWQPLIAAFVALTAAIIAWKNASRTIKHSAELERQKRLRKHASLRSVLPLTLSSISDYAARCDTALNRLVNLCVDEVLPRNQGIEVPDLPELPTNAIDNLAEFIEYSDSQNASLFEQLLARIQIHHSRLTGLMADLRLGSSKSTTMKHTLETYILHGAKIYAGAAVAYSYARREMQTLPIDISWDDVISAASNLRHMSNDYPDRVFEQIERARANKREP